MISTCRILAATVMLATGLTANVAQPSAVGMTLTRVLSPMDAIESLQDLKGNWSSVIEGPGGTKALRFEATAANEDFSGRIDLKALGVNPLEYDVLKFEVKADNGAFLQFTLENYPEPGDVSNWYPFDSFNRGSDWKTVWLDLKRPEEIQPKKVTSETPALVLAGAVRDQRSRMQGDSRCLWIKNLRFAKKAIDLECDQTKAPYEWGPKQDLVYRYPLMVTNRLDQPVVARLALIPAQVTFAYARLSEPRVELKPKQGKTVEVEVRLAGNVAERMPPLYCERFEVRGFAEGIADSETTIIRSKTYPLELTVTVPIPESKLQFPLLPRAKDLPVSLTGFDEAARKRAEAAAEAVSPDDLNKVLEFPMARSGALDSEQRGFWYHAANPPIKEYTWRYLDGLTACAFLYDTTGDRKYLEKGTTLLLRAAEVFQRDLKVWRQFPVTVGSHGILGNTTLVLAWATGGFSPAYSMARHGIFNDFDLLAKDMDPQAREKIIRDFIVPAAARMQQHIMYNGRVAHPILYAGLASRNWPLVSFGFSSERGIVNMMQWAFDEEGCAIQGHYHSAFIEPLLWATELLYAQGVNLYDQRLCTIIHSRSALAAGYPFRGPIVEFMDTQRFPKEQVAEATAPCDGLHLYSGVTRLRWKGLEVGMNWGKQLCRGSADRCSLTVNVKEKTHPLAKLMGQLGGGTYAHPSLQQSVIIVDENTQNPVAARTTGFHVDGPVQFVQATSDAHYPGTTITRTFAIVGPHALVIDRVTGKAPHTVDWMLLNAGPKVSLASMEEKAGGFTTKPDEPGCIFGAKLHSPTHFSGKTDGTWTEGDGRLTLLGVKGTEVMTFRLPETWASNLEMQKAGKAALMVRRKNVAETDFVACFSAASPIIERVPVKTAAGRDAQAVGLKITPKNGTPFLVIVNYEPEGENVVLDGLKTKARFYSDYQE